MARNRKKKSKSLYEVINRNRLKSSYDKTAETWDQEQGGAEPGAEGAAAQAPQGTMRWPRRPRMVQLNAGRVEFSIPFEIGIAAALGVILVILAVFRLGQVCGRGGQEAVAEPPRVVKTVQRAAEPTAESQPQRSEPAERLPLIAKEVKRAGTKGANRIVIQTYRVRAHLEPVKEYFASYGIGTEIRKISGVHYLLTSEKFENPERKGTDGYLAKQRIIELGANYKAPVGLETFGAKPFHDAYGMRFDD